MAAMLRRLDFHPVNEKAVRRVMEQLGQSHAVPAPEKQEVFRSVLTIGERDRVVLGREIRELVADRPRFDELRSMYRGRNYLLDVRQGEPYIVMRADCSLNDRFQAVMQAVMQAVHVERLQEGEEYAQRVAKDGPEAADRMLVSESLSRTPASVEPVIAEMKTAGWSVDKMRFVDSGKRARWEDAPTPQPSPIPPGPPETRQEQAAASAQL